MRIARFSVCHWSSHWLGGKVGISGRLVARTWRSEALFLEVILTLIGSPSPGTVKDMLLEAENLKLPNV